ncbi:hypothetical protein CFter6_0351 [Collimonas fungivorans]|uniref:Uncharacterized protein n=1 Tax=Collimonas fungivorans TaxID=158899 RepID=A0A127P5I9_9BURK|nr:hypothetical protein [Collimonas fungivorans]AMO93082.1 hypothetical protein CFter6_0351 [Collimonas fungivorans]
MPSALEITTFKLVKGLGIKDFIAANTDIDAWLKRQEGFQSRHIAELEDGSIVDMLIWRSAANGGDAASRIMGETADFPVHAAINQRSVVWRIAEVRHRVLA